MKNVRVFFEKKDKMKFISHLDMNRFFTRVLRKSGLPIWYTEGFNPHPYLTFALPLSLGFESNYEILDFKILDDDFPLDKVGAALSSVLPSGINVLSVAEPKEKAGKIAFAGFDIIFENSDIAQSFFDYLNGKNIVITKKTKRGQIKIEEISEKIIFKAINDKIVSVILPAGNDNINPTLLLAAYCEKYELSITPLYVRTAVYNEEKQLFK